MAEQLSRTLLSPRRGLLALAVVSTSAVLFVVWYNNRLSGERQFDIHRAFLLSRHIQTYPLLLRPRACPSNTTTTLLLAVKSHTSHFTQRQAIRNTWGEVRFLAGQVVQRVFLLGLPGEDVDVIGDTQASLVTEENIQYGDILQWGFQESFFNVTLKEVLFWRWFQADCGGSTRYVFKGDDDVFVDVGQVLDFLREQPNDTEPLYLGRTFVNTYPVHSWWSKYYIPQSMFSGPYPPYMGGGGYLISRETIRLLLQASEEVPLFPIDDAYVGMCAQVANISARHHEGFMPVEFNPSEDPCVYWGILVLHKLQPDQQYVLWNFYKRQGDACKVKSTSH